ncbi:MAG: hypothetical protein ABIP29_07305 [Candidatus Eisenbacteria bacterium]
MSRPLDLIRDADADEAFELLFFIAVATILATRGFLGIAGYPQLGGGGLHIAHMLWGGLFMFVAIGLLLVFWNPAMRRLAVVVGGVGFGLFIDELGKFITSDNDYFYRPTVAILYLIFLALWGFVRWLRTGIPLDAEELRVNEALRGLLSPPEAGAGRFTQAYFVATRGLGVRYLRLVRRLWFARLLTLWFLLLAFFNLVEVIALVGDARGRALGAWIVPALATVLEALFVWFGWLRFRRSRIAAYRWFQRSLLVSLLVAQVGQFYADQFRALNGVLLNVLLYLALTAMIEEERIRLAPRAPSPAPAPLPVPPLPEIGP